MLLDSKTVGYGRVTREYLNKRGYNYKGNLKKESKEKNQKCRTQKVIVHVLPLVPKGNITLK